MMTIWTGWALHHEIRTDLDAKKIGTILMIVGGLWGLFSLLELLSTFKDKFFPVTEDAVTGTEEEAP